MNWGRWLDLHLAHLVVQVRESARWRLGVVELRCAIGGRRNEGLVELRGEWAHVLLLCLLLLLLLLVVLLEARVILELGALECSWCAWLERGSKEELGRKQGSELHIESGTGSSHIVLTLLVHGLGVDGGDVRSSRMSVAITAHRKLVGAVGAVRESGITVGRLRGVAWESAGSCSTWPILGILSLYFLHPEKMRWQDRAVPHK